MNHDLADILWTYRHAWAAALLVGAAGAIVGVHVVTRRIAFVGIAAAQLGAAGVALAFLTGLAPFALALIAVFGGLFALGGPERGRRLPRDATVAALFVAASALTVLFVSRSGAELDQVEHIVYGNLLFATGDQVRTLLFAALAVAALHALLGPRFFFLTVDPEQARALGVPVRTLEVLLFASIGLVVALSIGVAGSTLTFAFLVLPPAVGLMLCDRFAPATFVSLATALLAAPLGTASSVLLDLPTGPTVVATLAALFFVAGAWLLRSWLAAPALLAVAVLAVLARPQPAPIETHSDSGGAPTFHVDLEIVPHEPEVRRGRPLELDYVVRLRGDPPERLHLVFDVGGELVSVPLGGVTRRTAGRVRIDTSAIEPGRYEVGASLWTGDPLDPDAGTELLPPDVCEARTPTVEILP